MYKSRAMAHDQQTIFAPHLTLKNVQAGDGIYEKLSPHEVEHSAIV